MHYDLHNAYIDFEFKICGYVNMIDDLAGFFKAAGDMTRLRILNLLLYHPVLNVNQITDILMEPQSKISRHLSNLRLTKWLVFNRRDKWVYYKLNPELSSQLLNSLKQMFQNYLQFENDLINAKKLL